ncbi:MAG: sensor histidine kinase [Calditrichaeota bacterium]|nr:sensor histidine kinase [Calditrichota bacterium]
MLREKLDSDTIWKLIIGFVIVIIAYLHYTTSTHLNYLHEIYRALFFLPIILAAFRFQLRGGILSSVIVIAIYIPHVVFQWGGDLFYNFSRFVQMIVYLLIGVVAGVLARRERRERDNYQRTAEELDESYQKLQLQSAKGAEIEDKLRDAEKLSVLGELAASLAHEVRNPLASIWGVMEILRDEYGAMGKKSEFVEVLFKEVNRLNQVVENYLALARKSEPVRQPCDLAEISKSVIFMLNHRAKKQRVKISSDFSQQPFIVIANENQLQQILINALLNSIAAMPDGGEIVLKGEVLEDWRKKLFIIDTGEGFSPELVGKVFKPFFTTKKEGTGLGLSIIKRIADENRWDVEIESEKNKGTVLTIIFGKNSS